MNTAFGMRPVQLLHTVAPCVPDQLPIAHCVHAVIDVGILAVDEYVDTGQAVH